MADQSTIIDMAHPSSQAKSIHDHDSGYASSDRGSEKQGTRGSRFRNALKVPFASTLRMFNQEGKDKRISTPSPQTSEYRTKTPTGEDEGSQDEKMVLPSDAPELAPPSDETRVRTHPTYPGWEDTQGAHHSSDLYNTPSGINDPINNDGGPHMDSTSRYTQHGVNGRGQYHQSTRPSRDFRPEEIAYFSGNHQRANETQIVGLRTSRETTASDRKIMNVTSNWQVDGNHNYGSSGQVVGQMVLDGALPRMHAGQFIGNQNFAGTGVVGMSI